MALIAVMLLAVSCPQRPAPRQAAAPENPVKPPAEPAAPAPAAAGALSVWADPALKAALTALAPQFQARYAPGLQLAYVERGTLLKPLLADPPQPLANPPQVFLIADRKALEALRNTRNIDELTARTFAGDRLVVLRRAGEDWKSPTLFDIYKLHFERLGIGSQDTALGYYSLMALTSEGGLDRIRDRIKEYPQTDAVVGALNSGEVQLAITYSSQAVQAQGLEVLLLIGADVHEEVRYQAVAAAGHAGDPGVQELLRFLAEEPAVQQALTGYGLLDRKTAMTDVR